MAILATTRSIRCVRRARRVAEDIRRNQQNGLIGNSSRRNCRDELCFLVLQVSNFSGMLLCLWVGVPAWVLLVPATRAAYVAWRCGADYRDREAASGYHTKIIDLEKQGLL